MNPSHHDAPSAPPRPDWLHAASVLTIGAMAAATLAVWRLGPTARLPMHFNLQGQVDRWGDRNEMALVMGGVTLVAAGIAAYCARAERDEALTEKLQGSGRFTFRFGRMIGLLAPAYVILLMSLITFDLFSRTEDGQLTLMRWTLGGLSLLFLVLGAFMGKARPNPVLGVRTYWSLTSRLAWDKSNRLAGRLFALLGLAGLVAAPLVPPSLGMAVMVAGVLLAAAWSTFESWRVWRIDPDRKQGA